MRSPSPLSMRLPSISTPIMEKLEHRLLDMILNLVAANMVKFDAKRWGKVPSAIAVE